MPQMQALTAEALKIFESVPDLYLILSPDLQILTASDAYLKATFTSRPKIVGKYVFDAFPDNPETPQAHSVANLHASLKKVLESRKPDQMNVQRYDVPHPFPEPGFVEKYWKPINTPVLDEQGEILYIIHKVSDVSEEFNFQRQIKDLTNREQAARLQVDWEQKNLKSILMQAPVGIAIFENEDHKIGLLNPQMIELLGRPAHELLGKPVFDALPDLKGQGFEAILSDVFTSGKSFEATEIPASLVRNGKTKQGFFNLVYQPLRNPDGKTIGIIQISIEVTEQVEGRKKIEQREKEVRLITNALPVLIGYLDKEEKYRFANKAYEEWFPLKAEELLGQPVRDVIGEKAYQGVKKYIDRALAGERLEYNAKMPYREDFIKYIHTDYVPDIRNGEVAGFYTLVADITEQTIARQQLEESEEKYRNLFETMDQGFCIMDMIFDAENKPVDYRFLEVNPTFESHTGLVGAKGKTAKEMVPDLENYWIEIYGKVALTGETAHLTQGSEAMGRWFEVNAFRLGGHESRKVALLFTDITQRKQMEDSLKRSNLWFKIVNKATQDAIWDWDLGTNKIKWNNGLQSMFNFRPEDVNTTASWWKEQIHPEDRQRVVNGIHGVIDSGREHWTAEYRFRTGDGGFKIVFDRGFVTHDENGKPVRMMGSMQDITDRKKAEENLKIKNEELTRINNDLDNFIYTASHDLKAPILNIEGLVNLLNKFLPGEGRKDEKLESIMGMIHTSISRFKETIKDLAEVAKVQSYAEEEVYDVQFEEVLDGVKLHIQSLINESGAIIHTDFSGAPSIRFSKKNLRSVVYNLISNAIKYRSPLRPPVVTITTSRPDDEHIALIVQDNGLGIKEKDKEKVFIMFKRLNQQVEGTGIGMAIVKKIVDNNGGKIELESTEGEGSAFKIYLKEQK